MNCPICGTECNEVSLSLSRKHISCQNGCYKKRLMYGIHEVNLGATSDNRLTMTWFDSDQTEEERKSRKMMIASYAEWMKFIFQSAEQNKERREG